MSRIKSSWKILKDEIDKIGGNSKSLTKPFAIIKNIVACLELHIEQGKVLEQKKIEIGIVRSIPSISRFSVVVNGQAGHSGTILMDQRADALVPERRGTSYYGPDNHKPLIAYRGLNIEFDFFVKNTDRKPQSIHNKTYTATILDRTSKASILTKTLVPVDYAQGQLVLKLDHEETLALDAKLYDLIVTYKITDVPGSYGGSSDQNSRVTFVLEAKDGAVTQLRPSIEDSTFLPNGDDRVGGRMEGPVLNNSKSGLNTVQVYLTNYTGCLLYTSPSPRD